jgi:PIN domain nuclease of toxin-antitoxin system
MPAETSVRPPRAVLDASALLAYLQHEQGHAVVEPLLERAAISAVNLSEVLQKALAAGVSTDGIEADLDVAGVHVYPFDAEDAAYAVELWAGTRKLGLSLGDRACLALAKRLQIPAYTADRVWAEVKVVGVTVKTVR